MGFNSWFKGLIQSYWTLRDWFSSTAPPPIAECMYEMEICDRTHFSYTSPHAATDHSLWTAHYLLPPFPLVPPPPVNLVPGINNGSSANLPYVAQVDAPTICRASRRPQLDLRLVCGWSLPYFTLHIQPLKMEQIECSETSAFNSQTPGKYPKVYTQDVYLIYSQLLSMSADRFSILNVRTPNVVVTSTVLP